MDPDIRPYNGRVWEGEYSSIGQPLTYEERVSAAQEMIPFIEGNQLILIDDLYPRSLNNPVWCTYGPCPNCAFLITQEGIIDTVQTWIDAENIELAIDEILAGK